ncbi:beta-N-acetylglucosaminidase domain-containing protein [uncultured Alistipes sp.]|uniref:beta-N-acetylglucosaminidase domain-containing protein n=1 Tax=uncultured Alistipes sp. TaxID=538949 RepID=UPI00265D9E58|nr:beta-N-acetylglucosaminidase domain-containing protein [uncultured Alistipes sp.]
MTNFRKLLSLLAVGLLGWSPLQAQDEGFDLASQRSESQDVRKVPGHVVDHGGIVINPTPHSLEVDAAQRLDISGGVVVKDRRRAFGDELDFLAVGAKGPVVDIDFGAKRAVKAGVKPLSGAYELRVGPKGVSIVGYDERGAFYGIQTLRQLAASPAAAGGKLPAVVVNDYPDLPLRGVVEGFYGTPWSHEVRLSLIDFYGRYKMNCYLYGPKDDPYHSCPDWRKPYPEKEARNIRELVEACRRNRVDFVWAIHPGQDIKWNEEDYANLVRKFEWMYDLGVRSFAIFFDDISGEGTNPVRQTELLNRLNEEFVKAKGDVAPLTVCPTDYSKLWANPTPQGSLSIYGKTLDPSVAVFWTGDVVCSDLTPETMEWVNSRIRRPAFYWWNYPVTDYVRHIIMQGPVYGLDTTLSADDLCGLVSNPMEHGEASKLALYGVADYTWNVAAYNPIDNWERGLAVLAPEVRDAYRTFAIHSCDTETGYRRDESWETETFRLADHTPERAAALRAELERVVRVPAEMEHCDNGLLLAELRPWLVEFGKLGERCLRTLDLMELYNGGDDAAFWAAYVANRMTPEELKAYEAHKSGTMKLQPFYEQGMDDMASGLFERLTGEVPAVYKGVGSFRNLRTTLSKLMFDHDSTTHYTSSVSQQAGDWIGADLGCVRKVHEVNILQGRNSVDDVDYFDHAIVEASADGREWMPLGDSLRGVYDIRWTGEPVEARYVRLRRLDSPKSNWASVRSFEVNPVRAERLGFEVAAPDAAAALYAFDRNPSTSFRLDGSLRFGIPAGTQGYTMLLQPDGAAAPVQVRQYAADGTLLSEAVVDEPFFHMTVSDGAATVEVTGGLQVFEIIAK